MQIPRHVGPAHANRGQDAVLHLAIEQRHVLDVELAVGAVVVFASNAVHGSGRKAGDVEDGGERIKAEVQEFAAAVDNGIEEGAYSSSSHFSPLP